MFPLKNLARKGLTYVNVICCAPPALVRKLTIVQLYLLIKYMKRGYFQRTSTTYYCFQLMSGHMLAVQLLGSPADVRRQLSLRFLQKKLFPDVSKTYIVCSGGMTSTAIIGAYWSHRVSFICPGNFIVVIHKQHLKTFNITLKRHAYN